AEGVVTAEGADMYRQAAGITLLRKICVGCADRERRLETSWSPPIPELLFRCLTAAGTPGVKG
ncbi:unnamed protein product, partial [Tetraodon nigroviridis]